MEDHVRRIVGNFPDKFTDLIGRDLRLSRRPLRCRRFDCLFEGFKIFDPAGDERFVIEFVLDDFVDNREVQGIIRSGADTPIASGVTRRDRRSGVDVGTFGTGIQRIHEIPYLSDLQGFEQITSIEDDMAVVFDIVPEIRDRKSEDAECRVVDVTAAGTVMVDIVG